MAELKKNAAQEEAIETTEGPLMIISCPGSGKTTTLVRRIHNIVSKSVPAERILMVTFTRNAAEEMQKKYKKMFPGVPCATFCTIHSFCYQVVLRDGGYKPTELLPANDIMYFMLGLIEEGDWVNDSADLAREVIGEISKIQNNYIDVRKYEPECCDKQDFISYYNAYKLYKERHHRFDMDDMLLIAKDVLENKPEVLRKYRKMFRYIQCDEYQDTNYVQRDILYLLAGKGGNLCVVGDDDQSIYAFRGARPEIMLSFQKDYPTCKVINMSTNYRSAQKIVSVSDTLIKENKTRFPKDFISQRGQDGAEGQVIYRRLYDRNEEMKFIRDRIEEQHEKGIPYDEMAILYRTNDLVKGPSSMLAGAKIPFYAKDKVKSIYEDWIYQCIRCYMLLGMGKGGRQEINYILNRPNRYLPTRYFSGVGYSRPEFLKKARIAVSGKQHWVYEAAEDSINKLFHNFGAGKLTPNMPAKEVFNRLDGKGSIRFTKYLADYAKQRHADLDDLTMQYDQLKEDAGKAGSIENWMKHADQSIRVMQMLNNKKDTKGVWLSTMHGSKGLEWNTVFLIDINKDIVPHKKSQTPDAIEEERRLFYVAMTRAKDTLYILNTNKESPFMEELSQKISKGALQESFEKPVVGSTWMHDTYGMGIMTDYDDNSCRGTIEFSGEEKKFQWPDAVKKGHLREV